MPSEAIKKIFIVLMLGSLTASAFFIRLENFKNTPARSIDEIVYYRMAKQILQQGLSGYNTIPYGRELEAAGRPLPQYFFEPLFKHPPLFTFLVALAMKIFEANFLSAGYVPLLLGTLLIPLGYALGTILFNWRIGLLSAFFLWLDPVTIICSQKVWMETTIAFFTLLSAVFFTAGLKSEKNWLFIFSGLSSGLAVNTKYPAFLITIAFLFYTFFYAKELFRNRKFQLSLILPFLSLLPWLYWNYRVYGLSSLSRHEELNSLLAIFSAREGIIVFVVAIGILLAGTVLWLTKGVGAINRAAQKPVTPMASNSLRIINILFLLFLGILLREHLWRGLQFNYLPLVSWAQGTFSGEPPLFYVGRLIEYSFFYIFAFMALFMYRPYHDPETALLRSSAFILLFFYIIWGNYQSRYILALIPFLIVLGAHLWTENFEKAISSKKRLANWTGVGLAAIMIYSVVKTYTVNLLLSYPNDMCYF